MSNTYEQKKIETPIQTSEVGLESPEYLKYQKALDAAHKVITWAEKEVKNGEDGDPKVPIQSAVRYLDTMTWDRYHYDEEGQQPFAEYPREVIEAQRIIFNGYSPSSALQKMQQEKYKEMFDVETKETLAEDVEVWGAIDAHQKLSVLEFYKQKLCQKFGIADIKMTSIPDARSAQATYLKPAFGSGPSGSVVWAEETLQKPFFEVLELFAHEMNHARQNAVLQNDDGLDDTQWFKLQDERKSFLNEDVFKELGGTLDEHPNSTYMSLPFEKDSFNAQKIFTRELEDAAAPYLDTKLTQLNLPNFKTTLLCIKISNLLSIQNDFGEPLSLVSLPGDSLESAKKILEDTCGGDLNNLFVYAKNVRDNAKPVLKDCIIL